MKKKLNYKKKTPYDKHRPLFCIGLESIHLTREEFTI